MRLTVVLALVCLTSCPQPPVTECEGPTDYAGFASALFQDYCLGCHSGTFVDEVSRGNAPIGTNYDTEGDILRNAEQIRTRVVLDGEMPPTGALADCERERLGAYLDALVAGACLPGCSGRVCGDDGCGGSCGSCTGSLPCDAKTGQCICEPDCVGRACGDDGCGGSCGTCTTTLTCDTGGACVCIPDCSTRVCGDDGCGGSCGTCGANGVCSLVGACTCLPDCTSASKSCGDDGCGGSCGLCPFGETCNAAGTGCACVGDCTGRLCGPDGCGGSCGTCPAVLECNTRAGTCGASCTPDCAGRVCGDDGCAGSCGPCGVGEVCDSSGSCLCEVDCLGKSCGDDGCGGSCGSCADGLLCSATSCACTPDCTGRICGDDGCGGSCGSCPDGQGCATDGTQCGCLPECSGLACGEDGCGGQCGSCESGQSCAVDTCEWNASSFSGDVYPIFQVEGCGTVACHGGARPAGNLDLSSSAAAYSALVSVPASQCVGEIRVVPGDPLRSYLLAKLTGIGMCVGTQMPKADVSLSSVELDAVRAWIGRGAAND